MGVPEPETEPLLAIFEPKNFKFFKWQYRARAGPEAGAVAIAKIKRKVEPEPELELEPKSNNFGSSPLV